jgi:hypothetical protein
MLWLRPNKTSFWVPYTVDGTVYESMAMELKCSGWVPFYADFHGR